jgi:hypothetical protein
VVVHDVELALDDRGEHFAHAHELQRFALLHLRAGMGPERAGKDLDELGLGFPTE